jgi:hypothetical protein
VARVTAAWIFLIAGTLSAAATACFVALVVFTGPPHGPFVEVVIFGAANALVLLVAAVWIRRGGSTKHGDANQPIVRQSRRES